MHVISVAVGTLPHSAVANMPYGLIIVEVPKGLMEGVHSIMSRNLTSGTLLLLIGDAYTVKCVWDGLPKMHDNKGPATIRNDCFISPSSTQHYSIGFTTLWVISNFPLPNKILLPVLASCCQSLNRCNVSSKCLSGF